MEDPSAILFEAYGPDVARVLIPRTRIAERVEQLARGISAVYGGGELTIVAALTGSLIFLSDLIRLLPMAVRLSVVQVSSYPGTATASTGPVLAAPPADLQSRHVLIVDDILDSGRTLELLGAQAAAAGAASVRTCVLISKRRDDLAGRRPADFIGFDIEDQFIVGYGLDYGNLYRNLPDICLLSRLAGGTGR